ncbi:MAG: substrate-binding domain-containing protein [Deltaproteobacteria bacterium]|nr:substrate-binding domain-containing protein [Deltaproteobacteria bacterium]
MATFTSLVARAIFIKHQASAEGLIIEDVIIGYQHPTIMVAKNNPLNIDTNLTNFFNTTFRTAIGDPESGSIGRQTRILLQKSGIYQKAFDHAQLILPDSRALYDAIVANKVDLTINWLSEGQHQHCLFVDTLSLPDNSVHRVTLKMALLSYSQHIDLAKRYLSLSCSPTAEVIFTRYGFGKTPHE